MKRIVSLAVALLALTMMLTLSACSGERNDTEKDTPQTTTAQENEDVNSGSYQTSAPQTDGVDLEALSSKILTDCGISDYVEIKAEQIPAMYGIDADKIVSAAGFNASSSAAFPQEVTMIQVGDDAAAADVQTKLESRLTAISDQAASYDPDSLSLAKSCKVVTKGNYVGLFFSEHYDTMVSDFQEAVG